MKEKIIEAVGNRLDKLEVWIDDVRLTREGTEETLEIVLDSKDMIDLQKVVMATRIINPILDKIDLIDSPGVLWPKIRDRKVAFNLASMSIIKEDVIPLDEVALYILETLSQNYEEIYLKMYGNFKFDVYKIEELYASISKFRNISFYQGEPDYERINSLIINDLKSERIKKITFDKFD